ncbi:putative vegetative incompatibility protein HET-E-1, partial [Rhizoctonia solani 123E]
MSTDTPGSPTDHERSRHWITDVEVTPANNDPNFEFSAKMFVDHELVCDLPAIDSTRPLRWSGLLLCNVSPASTLTLRLYKSRGKPGNFTFPPFTITEVDEETGETTLEHPKAVWVVTIKSLTPATVGSPLLIYSVEFILLLAGKPVISGRARDVQCNRGCIRQPAIGSNREVSVQACFAISSLAAKGLPESAAKVSFLICMKAWELLDQQAELDDSVQATLHGLARMQDIIDVMSQASNSMLATAMSQSKEAIHGILALLEDVSMFIFNRLTTNDLARASSEEDTSDTYDVEAYLTRLEELQRAFYSTWSPIAASMLAMQQITHPRS